MRFRSFRRAGLPVAMDRLLAMEPGAVIDAAPGRWHYETGHLWRGAAVGSLVLNMVRSDLKLNARGYHNNRALRNELWMSANYPETKSYAGSELMHCRQFGPQHAAELADLLEREVPERLPGIVYAVVEPPRHIQPVGDDTECWYTSKRVPFSHMDPYSRAALGEILGVELPGNSMSEADMLPGVTAADSWL